MKNFLRNNSLSIVLLLVFLVLLFAESFTGFKNYNQDQQEHSQPTTSYSQYLMTGNFIEGVFENWESEFLQMGAYVLLTVHLRQKGSAESKKLRGEEPTDRNPKQSASPDSPWPVRHGGAWLKVYNYSLSIAFILLFLLSFLLHAYGGSRDACQQNQQHGQPCTSMVGFMGTSEFWYQSFQNWQSEFLAVLSIVVLTIFLRQKGSPESKPVNSPYSETGS